VGAGVADMDVGLQSWCSPWWDAGDRERHQEKGEKAAPRDRVIWETAIYLLFLKPKAAGALLVLPFCRDGRRWGAAGTPVEGSL